MLETDLIKFSSFAMSSQSVGLGVRNRAGNTHRFFAGWLLPAGLLAARFLLSAAFALASAFAFSSAAFREASARAALRAASAAAALRDASAASSAAFCTGPFMHSYLHRA